MCLNYCKELVSGFSCALPVSFSVSNLPLAANMEASGAVQHSTQREGRKEGRRNNGQVPRKFAVEVQVPQRMKFDAFDDLLFYCVAPLLYQNSH